MTALTADTAFFSGRKIVVRIVGVIAALGLVAACTDDRGQPTNPDDRHRSWARRWVVSWVAWPLGLSVARSVVH